MNPLEKDFFAEWPMRWKQQWRATAERPIETLEVELEREEGPIRIGRLKYGGRVLAERWTALTEACLRSDAKEVDRRMAMGEDPFLPIDFDGPNTLDLMLAVGRRSQSQDEMIVEIMAMNVTHAQRYHYMALDREMANAPPPAALAFNPEQDDLDDTPMVIPQAAPGKKTWAQMARGGK